MSMYVYVFGASEQAIYYFSLPELYGIRTVMRTVHTLYRYRVDLYV